jgi:hypothetical protein
MAMAVSVIELVVEVEVEATAAALEVSLLPVSAALLPAEACFLVLLELPSIFYRHFRRTEP